MTEATAMIAGTIHEPRVGRRPSTGPVVVLSVLGSAVVAIGVLLPWVSFYGGLDHLRGVDGTNGRLLLGAATLTAAAALTYAVWPGPWLRWAIGAMGFGASGFAAWDLSQLLGTYRQLTADPFSLASLGPGAFLALAGSLVLLCTLLLPFPHAARPAMGEPNMAAHFSRGDARQMVRSGVIVFLLGAAMIHLAVVGEHLQESAVYAAFFVSAAVAQTGFALVLTARRQRPLLLGAIVVNTLFIGVWVISRTSGLPFGPEPGVAEGVALPDVLATVQEGLVVGLALLLAYNLVPTRSVRRGISRLGTAVFAVTASLATVLAVIAAQG